MQKRCNHHDHNVAQNGALRDSGITGGQRLATFNVRRQWDFIMQVSGTGGMGLIYYCLESARYTVT